MGRDPKIRVVVTGDTKGLEKAFKGAADGVNGFAGTLKRTLNTAVVTGALDLLSTGIQNAFGFAQTGIAQFDALGDSMAILDKNTTGLSAAVDALDLTKLGFDNVETAKAAESISSAAEALGLTDKQAKKLVPGLTKLSAGYSALSGTEPAVAGDLFAKALGGSAKAAKELGVAFSEGMTPAQRYQVLLEKWGPLTDDAANGTRSLADEQATMDAQLSDLSTAAGGFLNDALLPILTAITTQLIPAFQAFATEHGPAFKAFFSSVTETLGAVFGFITKNVLPIIGRLVGAIVKALGPAIDGAVAAFKEWLPIFEAIAGFIGTTIVPIIEKTLIPLLGKLLTAFTDISKFVAGALKTAFRVIGDVIDDMADSLGQAIDLIKDIVNRIANAPIVKDFLGFIGVNKTAAPRLGAPGGVGPTTRAAAGPFAATGGGAPIVINITATGDTLQTEQAVLRALRRGSRLNAGVAPAWTSNPTS